MNTLLKGACVSGVREEPIGVRVAIREVYECAYRALVAVGASAGEAATAADQVLFAELQYGDGLRGLLDDLMRGPWDRSGMRCQQEARGNTTVLHVQGTHRPGPLRQGALLVELAAAEAGPVVVLGQGMDTSSSLMDEVLSRTAMVTGRGMSVTDVSKHNDAFFVRVALPNGDVGHGLRTSVDVPSQERHEAAAGTAIDCPATENLECAVWLTGQQQRLRRADAALHGVIVEDWVWEHTYAASRRFLVPES